MTETTKIKTSPTLEFIRDQFRSRKKKNPRYSLRAFARDLEMEASTLAQILRGSRPLSLAAASFIIRKLDVEDVTRKALLLALEDPSSFQLPWQPTRTLTSAELRVVTGWQFYAILCALEMQKSDYLSKEDLEKKLGCPIELVEQSLDTLNALGLIRREGSRFMPTGEKLTTTTNGGDGTLIQIHRDHIEKALEALTLHLPLSDFTGMTLGISTKKLPEAVRRIRDFRRSLAAFLESDDDERDCVYRLNVQLFPFKGCE